MYIAQLEATLRNVAEAHRDTLRGALASRRFSTLVIGGAGIGKTKNVLKIGTDLDMVVIIVHIAQLEPAELLGIPRSVEIRPWVRLQRYDLPGYLPHYKLDEHGQVMTRVFEDGVERKLIDVGLLGSKVKNRQLLMAKHGEQWEDHVKGAIIFLDEINRAVADDTKQAIFELPGDYALHEYEVPEHCVIFAAGNPSTSDYQVNDMDQEKAWMDRFLALKAQASLRDSVTYFHSEKYDPSILSFIAADAEALMEQEEFFELNVRRTPRSYRMLDTVLKYVPLPAEESVQRELFMGILGTTYGNLFANHRQHHLEQVPEAKAVLFHYDAVRPLVLDAVETNKFSYVNQLARRIQTLLKDEGEFRSLAWKEADESDVQRIHEQTGRTLTVGSSVPHPLYVANLVQFLKDIGPEVRLGMLKQTISHDWVEEFLGPELELSDAVVADTEAAFQDEPSTPTDL